MNFNKKSFAQLETNGIKNFVAIDIETTGLKPGSDKILEIGAVYFENGEVVDTFNMLVNPERTIPWYITKINGISNTMVKNAPKEAEVVAEFYKFLSQLDEDVVGCAHNANFDFSFLNVAFENANLQLVLDYFDTLEIARKRVNGLVNYKQGTLEKHFDITNDKAHRAFHDAKACGEIMWKLLQIK